MKMIYKLAFWNNFDLGEALILRARYEQQNQGRKMYGGPGGRSAPWQGAGTESMPGCGAEPDCYPHFWADFTMALQASHRPFASQIAQRLLASAIRPAICLSGMANSAAKMWVTVRAEPHH